MTTTHKIAQASGGRSHFAAVTVEVSDGSPDTCVIVLAMNVENEMWREAAIAGARYALNNLGESRHCRVAITEILGTLADTSWDSVAYSACFAVWEALGVQGFNAPYWSDGKVHFHSA